MIKIFGIFGYILPHSVKPHEQSRWVEGERSKKWGLQIYCRFAHKAAILA